MATMNLSKPYRGLNGADLDRDAAIQRGSSLCGIPRLRQAVPSCKSLVSRLANRQRSRWPFDAACTQPNPKFCLMRCICTLPTSGTTTKKRKPPVPWSQGRRTRRTRSCLEVPRESLRIVLIPRRSFKKSQIRVVPLAKRVISHFLGRR